jgi:2-C-methyl-D-erythritol 2,4-cyclodiphosphate synthase
MTDASQRVGWGFDAHRFGGTPPVILAGIVVDPSGGIEATSDGDVVAHAVADALLGATALGDLGTYFPSSNPEMEGVDSMELLARVVNTLVEHGYTVGNLDVTVVAESVRIAPHREAMRNRLADVLGVTVDAVSVKATTTDGMGSIGNDEGLAVAALVSVRR